MEAKFAKFLLIKKLFSMCCFQFKLLTDSKTSSVPLTGLHPGVDSCTGSPAYFKHIPGVEDTMTSDPLILNCKVLVAPCGHTSTLQLALLLLSLHVDFWASLENPTKAAP